MPYAAEVLAEISLSRCNILNVIVPAATACAMGLKAPAEAATEAENAAYYISASIPGAMFRATEVGKLAKAIINFT